MSSMKLKKLLLYIIAIVFAYTLFYRVFQDSYETKMLKDYFKGEAILIQKKPGAVRSSKSGKFYFKVKNKYIYFTERGDYFKYKIGDTFNIIYSKKDNAVAKVIRKKI